MKIMKIPAPVGLSWMLVVIASIFFCVNSPGAPGDLYEADNGSNSILRFTPDGSQITFATGLNLPLRLAFDKEGNLFESDRESGTIIKFTLAGSQSIFASGLNAPDGLAFDSAGNLYEADIDSGTIFKFTSAWSKSVFASGLSSPLDLAFDSFGNLFVSVDGSNSIIKFTPGGSKSTFASGLSNPRGLAFDNSGNLFVTSLSGGTIFKFSPDGIKSTFASGLNFPHSIAFDGSGNLFVTDDSNSIFKFTPVGAKSTLASGLNIPVGLAFEPVLEKLRNISARALVGTGDDVLIGGFIVGGNGLANNAVVARAVGPSLALAGVTNPLADPFLELYNAGGTLIASNDNWQDSQEAEITATGLAPTDPNESAIFSTLPAGSYTAVVRGVGDTSGVALVEVYSVAQ